MRTIRAVTARIGAAPGRKCPAGHTRCGAGSISSCLLYTSLLILPVSLVLVMLVVRFSQKYFKAQQATLGVVNGQVEEVYSGHNVIKAFNREAAVLELSLIHI